MAAVPPPGQNVASRPPCSTQPIQKDQERVPEVLAVATPLAIFYHVRYENLVGGVIGGILSNLVLHPMDLVKIRFAVSDGLRVRPKYRGIAHCLHTIWKQDGVRGLYQGLTPNVWGAGLSWGLYFCFYNAIKSYKSEGRTDQLKAPDYLFSAAQAGAMTLCFTNPLWVTKTRLMLQYDHSPEKRKYDGMIDTLVKIYKADGVRGLYRGFMPGLLGTSHGALQFMTYEMLKKRYNEHMARMQEAQLSTIEYISIAAIAKIFAVAATYPYQVVRARLQDQHIYYQGIRHVIRRTWKKEGIQGFYKGIVPNLITVTPACCITFVVYENVSQFLCDLREGPLK
ncbi:mitochondrial folate transporter/carrier-like isoform X1 [Monodelphis domestica]|uniref:Solute carrier family 25 member 32 n=1 Tax=Monodelphis domestica TaxID=13616 RepID=F6YS95_MONDO|nr:mitochondrial folate transporter/carrier-like isoform X1 [Monodelphis domestica]